MIKNCVSQVGSSLVSILNEGFETVWHEKLFIKFFEYSPRPHEWSGRNSISAAPGECTLN